MNDGQAGDVPTSLAYNGDWSQGGETQPDPSATEDRCCPRKLGFRFISQATGNSVAARCCAHFCGYCGPLNARIEALAIGLAAPERAIRFSLVGEHHQQRRQRIKEAAYRLRRRGYTVEWAWHVEPNPAETGHHAHMWQHGSFIPQDELQAVCKSVGMGFPYIEAIKQEVGEGKAVGYGLKGVRYGLKMAESRESMETYLDANGGRLVHASRGFWRDGGERITLVEARKRVKARMATGDDEGPWVLVRVGA